MKKIFKMVVAVAAIGLTTASCKKNLQVAMNNDSNNLHNASISSSDFDGMEFCTELYPEGIDPRAAATKSKKWKNGSTITVKMMGGDSLIRSKVVKYANVWTKYANISFKFVDKGPSNIRVTFNKGGSNSYLGTDALSVSANRGTMNYGWFDKETEENEFSRVIIHEFGHALGLVHEHQHPLAKIPWDKAKVYAYYKKTNKWDSAQVESNMFRTYSKRSMQYSKYDPKSIMHYAVPLKLITDSSYAVGWNRKLSATDKSFIAIAYPKKK